MCALVSFTSSTPAFGASVGAPVSTPVSASVNALVNARATGGWAWPVAAPHPVVRGFEAPETTYSAGHRGIDVAAPADATVRAPADGVIHFSGFVVNRHVVSIDHGNGILSSYEPVLSPLSEGTAVQKGDPIGVLQSGHCGTPCLHFGIRLFGQYVSPLLYLGGLEPSVLWPTREIG